LMSGFTENYIRVEIPHNPKLANEIREVTLMKILPNGNMTATLNQK
jgi:threonylcarbamoyladenosine tRNA methylthiotransferase MtaB